MNFLGSHLGGSVARFASEQSFFLGREKHKGWSNGGGIARGTVFMVSDRV